MKFTISFLCYCWLALSAPASVIITVLDPPALAGLSDEIDHIYVDFNRDGVAELLIYNGGGSLNNYFFKGNRIGSFIRDPDPQSRPYGDRESQSIIEVDSGRAGDIINKEGAMGFEFKIGSGTHYGYIHYNFTKTNGTDFSGGRGTILGWAYENVPGRSIIATPIPEPSSWMVLVAGGAAACTFRRRRDLDRKKFRARSQIANFRGFPSKSRKSS